MTEIRDSPERIGDGTGAAGARVLSFRPRRGAVSPLQQREDASLFRRRRGALRHARRHPFLRLLRPLLVAAAIVGAPVSATLWLFGSSRCALQELDVRLEPDGRVSAAWVHQALRPALGWNLARLPLGWVDGALKRHPWVDSTDLRKQLPDRLVVRVIEKREVALGRGAAEAGEPAFWYLDEGGGRIAPFDPLAGETDLVLVSGATGVVAALRLRDEIEALSPGWAAGLSEIEVLGEEDFRVWSADLPFPLLVRAGTVALKNDYLEMLLPEILHRYDEIAAVDLRFTRRIILQPIVHGRETAAAGVLQKG